MEETWGAGHDSRSFGIELEGDLMALLSLGLGPNTTKAGACVASGPRVRVRSLMVVAVARNHRELPIPAVAI